MHLGRYHELDVFDIYNDPNAAPEIDTVGQRARLEEKLQMWFYYNIKKIILKKIYKY